MQQSIISKIRQNKYMNGEEACKLFKQYLTFEEYNISKSQEESIKERLTSFLKRRYSDKAILETFKRFEISIPHICEKMQKSIDMGEILSFDDIADTDFILKCKENYKDHLVLDNYSLFGSMIEDVVEDISFPVFLITPDDKLIMRKNSYWKKHIRDLELFEIANDSLPFKNSIQIKNGELVFTNFLNNDMLECEWRKNKPYKHYNLSSRRGLEYLTQEYANKILKQYKNINNSHKLKLNS